MSNRSRRSPLAPLRLLGLLALLLALAPPWVASAQSGGTVEITVVSIAEDGGTPIPFSRFQLLDEAGNLVQTRETAPPDATTTFTLTFEEGASYTLSMETPPACAFQPDDQIVGPFEDGDAIDQIFEVAFEDGCTLGSVSAYAYACPDGIEAGVDDYAYYRDNCVTPVDGETFTLAELPEGGQSFDLVTGSYGIPGRAPIVGLIPGDFGLSQNGSDPDRTIVYCMAYDGTPIEAPNPDEITREGFNDNGQIELDLEDRNRIACDFFAVAGEVPGGDEDDDSGDDEPIEDDSDADEDAGDDDEDLGPAGGGDGTIEFHVATCPAGYDGSDHYNDCSPNGTEDVTFTVDGQFNGYSDSATSSQPVDPGFGVAVISGLPADTYTMSEDVPGDFVALFVYCADSPGGGPRIPTPENGFQEFDIELAPGQSVICDWYITPDQQFDPAILRLTKFTCEPGYDGSSFGDFTTDCPNPTDGVTFNLTTGSGYDQDETTNDDGRVRFTDLAPGDDYVLTEDLPGDALDNRVAFCAVDGGDYIEYGVERNGSIDLDPIGDGDEVQCLWYNVPADQGVGDGSGSVEIHLSECPPGTSGDFYNRCHDNPMSGVPFELNGPGGADASGETNDDGVLIFAEVPEGDYVLTEANPVDFDLDIYAAFCTLDGESFPTEYDDGDGLRITFELPEGADIICDWYNVERGAATETPVPSEDGGTITVIKRLCLDDLDEISNFAEECEMYGAGVEFELTSLQNGNKQQRTTNNDSRAVFTGLADGAYALDELEGDWCKAQADRVDASGNVLVQNEGNTNVYIYNCGDRDINTLPSTGSGDTGSDLPATLWIAAAVAVLGFAGSFVMRPQPIRKRIRR